MDFEAFTPCLKTRLPEQKRLSPTVRCKAAHSNSASGSEASTHLICGELLDLMPFESSVDFTPTMPSSSGSSLMTVTTSSSAVPASLPSGVGSRSPSYTLTRV